MKVKIDSEIKVVNTEEAVEIIRSMKGMIDEVNIRSIPKKEITEEKKSSLSDRKVSPSTINADYYENDVKEAIKEFIEWLVGENTRKPITEKAREIFGERLI